MRGSIKNFCHPENQDPAGILRGNELRGSRRPPGDGPPARTDRPSPGGRRLPLKLGQVHEELVEGSDPLVAVAVPSDGAFLLHSLGNGIAQTNAFPNGVWERGGKSACEISGHAGLDHLVDVNKMVGLGSIKWDRFPNVVAKAKTAGEISGCQIIDHFANVGKMVEYSLKVIDYAGIE